MKRSSFLKLPLWDLTLSGLTSKFALMLFCLVLPEPAQSQDNPPFLSDEAKQIVKDSTYIEVRDIPSMRYTPELIEPGDPNRNKIASPEQLTFLQEALLNAKPIDASNRLSSCKYLPGAAIRFFRKKPENSERLFDTKPELTVLLCFNCDVWAVEPWGSERKPAKDAIAFGDSRPKRQELKQLMLNLFGEHFWHKGEVDRMTEGFLDPTVKEK